MRTLTKTGIRILSAKYRSILIKCAIINASVFIGAFGAGSAMAADVVDDWNGFKGAINGTDTAINVNADITFGADILNPITRDLSIVGDTTSRYLSGNDTYGGLQIGTDTDKDDTLKLQNISMQHFKKLDNGAAINNKAIIAGITGNFVSNSSKDGGAIYNEGAIVNIGDNTGGITANFEDNSATNNGGAIYNEGTITSITGNFEGNSATNNGGAIYNFKHNNYAKITSISGKFSGNSANIGGAIYNIGGGEIGNITGDFEGNFATNNGGAIRNDGETSKIGIITGNFKGNHADSTSGYGGAIYNSGIIENITGDFENNYTASTTMGGGAIANIKTINISTSDEKSNILFKGNYITNSNGKGGAIWNVGTVGLYAVKETDSITFKGGVETGKNDIDGICNTTLGTKTGVLNINGYVPDSTDENPTPAPVVYAGTVNLQNVDGDGTTNIYGGSVNVAKDITQNNINVLSGATLSSTTNGASIVANDTFTNAGTVNMSGDDSKLLTENLTNNGTIDVVNVVTEDLLTNNNTINATGIEVGDILTNNGAIEAVNLLANDIANNGNITATDIKLGSATNNSGASLTVNGKINTASLINEGKVTFNNNEILIVNLTNSGTVNFNGYLNYPDSNVSITQNAGTINFSGMADTEGNPIKVFKMNGGLVNIADGSVNTLHINQLNLTGNIDFTIDADLENEISDRIKIHDIDNSEIASDKTITIKGINLLSDATQDKINLSLFADNDTRDALKNNVRSKIKGLTYSSIYKYNASYDSETGMIGFTRYNSGTSDDFNPYLYAPSGVANTTAAMTTQIATLAMDKMDDVVHAQGRSGGDTPSLSNAWVRVMGLNDNVEFNNFENIDSKALTVAAGVNTDKITCGDCGIVFGAYAGYIGGKQKYTENDIDQDGGYVGLSSALTLRNAFLTATVNGGLLKNKANNMYGTDRFNTLWLGTGLKAGYNYAITDSVVLQPNVYGGYTLVNTQDYTSVSGVKIATNNLNFFEIDPGLKLSAVIADGWTGSVQGKYAIVMDNGADITANDIALQNISPKNYFEYGIGIDKSVTDAFYLGAKINRHDGGRTGWNGSIEFRYKF